MTTGGPDTSDIYVLTLNPTNHMQYRYDGQWRTVEARAGVEPTYTDLQSGA